MGREARANPRTMRKGELKDGPHNPEKNRLMARFFNHRHPVVQRLRKTGKVPRVVLAGQAYLVDEHGTYRRAPIEIEEKP